MIKKVKSITKALTSFAMSKSTSIWQFKTLHQLRFKFAALKHGIELNTSGQSTLFNLRRNIHRLEKGLSYPVAKEVFAEDYIVETIQFLKSAISKDVIDDDTLNWAISVLKLYFKTVKLSDKLKLIKNDFEQISSSFDYVNSVPYHSSTRPPITVTYEDLLSLSVRRRSVRYFHPEPVDIELVRKAYEIAKYAPSACNRQAFQFLFYNEKTIVDKLAAIPGGVSGYSLPSIMVVLGRYDGYFDVRDINAPVIDSSLSIMSFLYAAETLGMGTVCINWPNLPDREAQLRKVLNIDKSEIVVMMIGLGYPLDDGKIPFSAKRPNKSALLFNERKKLSE
ncbi:nitroreductase family protein [Dyadobacter chenhuakuii]|uniref:Nitroreductase family protein n=1 Tax=Dyadobacter chenhuakuii TaxID=2909339 RepID=A0A9X1QGI6_9BACT|nr:nitroreductase family protein [Dyadobacter chenhuakuii]MCF2501508.1 nitroreductase family protein [Dyadobacter chenhuakuii]